MHETDHVHSDQKEYDVHRNRKRTSTFAIVERTDSAIVFFGEVQGASSIYVQTDQDGINKEDVGEDSERIEHEEFLIYMRLCERDMERLVSLLQWDGEEQGL